MIDSTRPNDERGFIHKKILGIGGGIVSGFLGGGPLGAITGGVRGFVGGGARAGPPPGPQVNGFLPRGSRVQRPTPGIGGAIARFLPGGSSGFTTIPESLLPGAVGPGGLLGAAGARGGITGAGVEHADGVCPPRGFHLNKSSYFLRDGTFVPARSRMVRNRRLNNANGRAQDKAIVRLEKGQDHAKKLLRATGWRTISKQSSREMRNKNKKVCQ